MYPAQTSLIPVGVALTRFLEQGGSPWGNYPYWYLGTTPFRFLTGPILPYVLVFSRRLLPFFSLFDLMFILVGLSFFIGGVGVYFLIKGLIRDDQKVTPVLAALFYLFSPIAAWFFRFSNGLGIIAFSFLPFVWLEYSRFLRRSSLKTGLLLVTLTSFVILLDASIISSMILGMGAIFLSQGIWKKAEARLGRTLVILFLAIFLTTIWYTPGFWLTSLFGPSLGGKPRLEVFFQLSKLLPTALAIAAAIFFNKIFKAKDALKNFSFYFLFIFGFLTLMRFIADPDFWQDWSIYYLEMQMGLAILFAFLLKSPKLQILSISFSFLLFIFVFNKDVWNTLQRTIDQSVEYEIGKELDEIVKPNERVFLSGTTAFWLNSFFDIAQVRGGVDQVSLGSWREVAWEIREGDDLEKTVSWMEKLKIDYLVVHDKSSREYYHDFTYPEKFAPLKKIYDNQGDQIYESKI